MKIRHPVLFSTGKYKNCKGGWLWPDYSMPSTEKNHRDSMSGSLSVLLIPESGLQGIVAVKVYFNIILDGMNVVLLKNILYRCKEIADHSNCNRFIRTCLNRCVNSFT